MQFEKPAKNIYFSLSKRSKEEKIRRIFIYLKIEIIRWSMTRFDEIFRNIGHLNLEISFYLMSWIFYQSQDLH